MYKVYLLFLLCCIAGISFGQTPQKFNYQAVVRDGMNHVIQNQNVTLQIKIRQGNVNGTEVYTEDYDLTTNEYGLVSLFVGEGPNASDFADIDWQNGPYFISTAIDLNAGNNFTLLGTNQLISVPYALSAKYAEYVGNPNDADANPTNEIQDLQLSGNILTITNNGTATQIDLSAYLTGTQLTESEVDAFVANNGYITNANDADADATNEIQDLQLNGNILTITNNGAATQIDLSAYLTDTQLTESEVDAFVANNGYITNANDADADATNEIQDLQLNGNILTITNNGTATQIDLSAYLSDTQLTESEVDAFVANNGYITNANDADADATNEIQDLQLNGNILTITNNGTATQIDLSAYLSDTQLTETEVDAFVANNGYITNANDADADANNEIQDLQLSGNILTITNNGTATQIDLSAYLTDTQLTETEVDAFVANNGYITNANDADADASNEIQDLQLSGNILTITNNGTATQIDLSAYLTDTQLTESEVDAFVANNGYITNANDADSDATNEIQDLQLNGNILTITNNGAATQIDLSAYLADTTSIISDADLDTKVEVEQNPDEDLIRFTVAGVEHSLLDTNGILVKGSFDNSYGIPSLGGGSRMVFYPKNAVFRAGRVSGTQWDDANAGNHSVAFGRDNTASGSYSFSSGRNNTASGGNSFVFGESNQASGNRAVVLGGDNNVSSGDYSITYGQNNNATGLYTIAGGNGNTADGIATFASGMGNNTEGLGSVAIGLNNTSSANASIALGSNNTASNKGAVAVGDNNTTSGELSVAFGKENTVSGNHAFAIGDNNSAIKNEAVAIGLNNQANAINSFVLGRNNIATDYLEFNMGRYAISNNGNPNGWSNSDNLFTIGRGTSTTNRKNAFQIKKSGAMFVAGKIRVGGSFYGDYKYEITNVDGDSLQVLTTDGHGNVTWKHTSSTAASVADTFDIIADADRDTKISLEENADEDVIRFDVGGTEMWKMSGNRLETSSDESIYIGKGAGLNDVLNNQNVFIGDSSGNEMASANNTLLGYNSGKGISSGSQFTIVGHSAGTNATGNMNSFYGIGAGANHNGSRNEIIGAGAGYLGNGNDNVFVGGLSGISSDGNNNVAVGKSSLNSTAGYNNVAVGYEAGHYSNGSNNLFLGYQQGKSKSESNKLRIGSGISPSSLIVGDFLAQTMKINAKLSISNPANGSIYYSFPNVAGTQNQIMVLDGTGNLEWKDITSDTLNILTDTDKDTKITLEKNTDEDVIRFDLGGTERWVMTGKRLENIGDKSLYIGKGAGLLDVPNNENLFIGDSSGNAMTSYYNTMVGVNSGKSISSGSQFTIVGRSAGEGASGHINSFFGIGAGMGYSGSRNELIGSGTGFNGTGDQNVLVGGQAGNSINGNNNVAIGRASLRNTTGANNVALGYEAGYSSNGSNNVFLGYLQGKSKSESNRLRIGSGNSPSSLIWGDFAAQTMKVNGKLSISDPANGNIFYSFPNTAGAQNQIMALDGSGNLVWTNNAIDTVNILADADRDTYINTEATSDEDKIRFHVNGEDKWVMTKNRLENNDNSGNILIGINSGMSTSVAGGFNTFIGNASGFSMSTARYGTFIGAFSGYNNQGANNTFIGYKSGENNVNGTKNTFVGKHTGQQSDGSGNVFLGYEAGLNQTGSNLLMIDNSSTATPLIHGNFTTNRLGINRVATTNSLEVGGEISSASGNLLVNSDKRLKKDIASLNSEEMLKKLMELKGVNYYWNDTVTGYQRDEAQQIGMIAQNIKEVFPTLVKTDKQGYLQTSYSSLDAITIEAMRALLNKVEKLEAENKRLKEDNSNENIRLSNLEKELESIKALILEKK